MIMVDVFGGSMNEGSDVHRVKIQEAIAEKYAINK